MSDGVRAGKSNRIGDTFVFKLAIHIEGGVVQRVEADADVLQNMEVAVLVDKQPARLLRPVIEKAVTGYVESVRGAELAHGLASACHVIGHAFSVLGTRETHDADAFLRDVEVAMMKARTAIDAAKSQAGWTGATSTIFEDIERSTKQVAAQPKDQTPPPAPPLPNFAPGTLPQAQPAPSGPTADAAPTSETGSSQHSLGNKGRRLKLRAM